MEWTRKQEWEYPAIRMHIQVYRGTDPTPLNPLRHLYEYHHPGEPLPQLPEFFPESVPPRPDSHPRRDPLIRDDPAAPNRPLGMPGPASPNRQPPTLPADKFGQPPTAKPRSNVGQPLDITPFQFRNPPAPGGGFGPPPDPTGSLYFSPQPPPRQFGPFTVPGPGGSGTDILGPRNGIAGNSSIPMVSAPGQVGNGRAPAAPSQPINGNAADQAGGGHDIGGVWTTARQYMGGQAGRMPPVTAPAHQVPAAFPQNGAQPIGTINGANQTGIFDPAASLVPLPRPRPPQAPAASWPSEPVAPLLHLPQAGAAAPEHPDWHDAGDWPQQGLPSWAQNATGTTARAAARKPDHARAADERRARGGYRRRDQQPGEDAGPPQPILRLALHDRPRRQQLGDLQQSHPSWPGRSAGSSLDAGSRNASELSSVRLGRVAGVASLKSLATRLFCGSSDETDGD
jgi:hypothetical protein